jgi:hypothetical protein
MARSAKLPASWDSVFFNTPEQKVLRFLLGSPDSSYSLRVLVSKLKGVRGLGGLQGLEKILVQLEEIGVVNFIDNRRGIRVQDEHPAVSIGRRLWALCEVEGLHKQLQEICSKGIITEALPGEIRLYVVTDKSEEAKQFIEQSPVGKSISLTTQTRDEFESVAKRDPKLHSQIINGVLVWGSSW